MNDDFRSQIFNILSPKETSELIEIWQGNTQLEWTETAYDVIQEILQSRLGELPPQNMSVNEPVNKIKDDKGLQYYGERVQELSKNSDINGLVSILETEFDPVLCIQAAEALARLGDERGLDYLINALEVNDPNIRYDAEEILSEINIPKGIIALHSYMLKNKRTIYTSENESLSKSSDSKKYVISYISLMVIGSIATLIIYFIPAPPLVQSVLNIITGYYIFKFVIKSEIIGL